MVRIVRKPHERQRLVTKIEGASMTKQSSKAECDINTILKKYRKTGLITHMRGGGTYADLPSDIDYQTGMNMILVANEAFNALPATLRKRFGNDPAEFLAFVQNPENADELIRLGLAKPRPAEQNEPAEAGSPTQSPEPASGS